MTHPCYTPSCPNEGTVFIEDINIPVTRSCWLCAECVRKLRASPETSEAEQAYEMHIAYYGPVPE